MAILKGGKNQVRAITFNPKGKLLVGTKEGSLRLHNEYHTAENTNTTTSSSSSSSRQQPRDIEYQGANKGDVTQVKFNPCCSHQFACITSKGCMRIFDTKQTTYTGGAPTTQFNVNDLYLKSFDWCPTGQRMAVVDSKNNITLYHIDGTHPTNIGEITSSSKLTLKERVNFPVEITQLMWDRKGKTLYIASENGRIYYVREDEKLSTYVTKTFNSVVDDKNLIREPYLLVGRASINCMDISQDDKYLIVGSEDSAVSIFELPDLICVHNFSDLGSLVTSVSVRFSQGKYLVLFSTRNEEKKSTNIILISMNDGKVLFKSERDSVSKAILHPSMNYIAFYHDSSYDVVVDSF